MLRAWRSRPSLAGDDAAAAAAAAAMRRAARRSRGPAEALAALAAGEPRALPGRVEAIVADFEARDAHVTGVPVADTAMLMEALADPRGIAARPRSPLIPQPAAR